MSTYSLALILLIKLQVKAPFCLLKHLQLLQTAAKSSALISDTSPFPFQLTGTDKQEKLVLEVNEEFPATAWESTTSSLPPKLFLQQGNSLWLSNHHEIPWRFTWWIKGFSDLLLEETKPNRSCKVVPQLFKVLKHLYVKQATSMTSCNAPGHTAYVQTHDFLYFKGFFYNPIAKDSWQLLGTVIKGRDS